jgi:LysM repeat protein
MQRTFIRFLFILAVSSMCIFLFINNQKVCAKEYKYDWHEPVNGVITDTYGTRNGKHKGIDIAASEGSKIVSVDRGVVAKSYYSDSYGNVVFVKHSNGYETVYAHLKSRNVAEGDIVKKGELVGIIGNTGISTGTHLHFEVHNGAWTVNKQNSLDPFEVIAVDKITGDTVAVHAKYQSKEDNHDYNRTKSDLDYFEVRINSGDTLWGLSQIYSVPVEEIKSINQLSSNTIRINQTLTLYKK